MATIAVSDCVREHILSVYGADPAKVVRIHRGADVDRFRPDAVEPGRVAEFRARLGVAPGAALVTLPGRLTYWKGQKMLLEAVAAMRRAEVAALFVGSDQGRTAYTAELKEMAAALPAGKTALFLEHTDDMPLVYAASDVVVSASSAQPEAFGRVIPEAQAMGRIVVGTAHGGACETVADGVTGFLAPPGDAAALAAALDRALEMPADEAAKMRAAAVESVRENFSTARMCERTLEFYSKIHSTLSHGNVI